MPGHQQRQFRLCGTAVAVLALHPSCYGLETSRARSAYAKRPLLSSLKQRGGRKDPAAPTPLTRNGRCRLATRGCAHARRLGLPKAKPTTRGAPP